MPDSTVHPLKNDDRQSGRLPYKALWTACFFGYAAIGMTIQVIPMYTHDTLSAGPFATGLAVTIGSLATMVVRPIAGRSADRRGERPVVMLGAALGVLGGLAHLFAFNLSLLIIARLILGAGEGALFTGAIGWVLSKSNAARRGKIAGHFGLSMWGGLASGPILGGVLLATFGFQAVWLTASILPFLAWLLLIRSPRTAKPRHTSVAKPTQIFPRAAWLPGAAMMFASIGYGVVASFLVPRFDVLGLPGKEFALALFGGAFLVMRFLGSAMVDRYGALPVLALTCLIEALGMFGLMLTDSAVPVIAFTLLSGAGISMLFPCLADLVVKYAHVRERSAALGSMTSAWDLGLAVGGPLGGALTDSSFAIPFGIAGTAAMAALIPIFLQSKQSADAS